jgi:hypothetical protein
MKSYLYLCALFLTTACSPTDDYEGNELIDSPELLEWIEPIDTLEVIETNFWTAKVDSFHFPFYMSPIHGGVEFFGREYNFVRIENGTISFSGCAKGHEFDFSALINRITEDSLILEFIEGNTRTLPVGSILYFKNDREFFHEDFKLQTVSYSATNPMSTSQLVSIEFNEDNYYIHLKNNSSRSNNDSFKQGEMTSDFFEQAKEHLSKIRLSKIEDNPIDPEFIAPFNLLVEYNGKTETLEGDKLSMPPRFDNFISFIEDEKPQQPCDTTTILENFFNAILNGEFHESLDKIDYHKFKVKELKLDPRFKEPEIMEVYVIDVIEEIEVESIDY